MFDHRCYTVTFKQFSTNVVLLDHWLEYSHLQRGRYECVEVLDPRLGYSHLQTNLYECFKVLEQMFGM